MRLDNILHNSPDSAPRDAGTDWLNNRLTELPLTPLSSTMTPADDSYEIVDQNGRKCRCFPAGPNRSIGYITTSSSVHQSYGLSDNQHEQDAQLRAALEFRNAYLNPSQSFLTARSSLPESNHNSGSHSIGLASTNLPSHHAGTHIDSDLTNPMHQSHWPARLNNSTRAAPVGLVTPRNIRTLTPQTSSSTTTPSSIRPYQVVDHGASPIWSSRNSTLLDLDEEIEQLHTARRTSLDHHSLQDHLDPESDSEEASHPVNPERLIMIEYRFHMPAVEEQSSSTRKRKPASAAVEVPKTRVFDSIPGKITVAWDFENTDLSSFKSEVFKALSEDDQDDDGLPEFVEAHEAIGNINWYGSVLHCRDFAVGGNKQLDKPGVFAAWLTACKKSKPGRKLTCRLDQTDPKAIAKRAAALKGISKRHKPSSEESTFQPSSAAADRAKINQFIGEIFATHTPRPSLTGSSDKSVFINPEKTQEYFVVTMAKAEAWGKAMNSSPETVDLRTPPKTPQFEYITGLLEPEGGHPARGNQLPPFAYNPYGNMYQPMHYPPAYGYHGHPHPPPHPTGAAPHPAVAPHDSVHQANPSRSQPESSPAPSDSEVDDNIREFLKYARVDSESSAIQDGLTKLGITHWSMFRHVTSKELLEAGVPLGPARTIEQAAKRYSDHLKKRTRANGA
ncbi:uncharacterized protein PGTG_15574 [Puccinia graminis f. sp. tritici CRL 75-36-700-3]|uniref:SAM domain-containing protein n=1 Tax=Puccinia graminis f. sp. tritici (strain CRL 75-36-700-3 / race SCCL) TaxID=418459 RepID=E3KZ86_PUCGT|nr:uncharacterized protein PGTG_15574 [Puccinia graminis f. sp. tritici CRL 75-36-700-3]EFP89611.2 hypothetical protein PGTG_15574 [Puccinia graminis f. sp. tritici CRL 75-36-700-3]